MPIKSSASGVPAGRIEYFSANAVPPGRLRANGALVSRTVYARLFLAIGTTYGAGDGVTTFALPDCRAEFLRGLDDGRGVDAGRAIGSAQADSIKSHSHGMNVYNGSSGFAGTAPNQSGAQNNGQTEAVGGSETRPRNVAMLACITF